MRLVRTMLVIAISAALALLPVGASAAGFAGAGDHGVVAAQADGSTDMSIADMSMDEMSMDDCCPHAKANPCDGTTCPLGFCVAPCVGLADVSSLRFDFPAASANALPIPADQVASRYSGSPPFRPPRV
jgi:hypothetical protein